MIDVVLDTNVVVSALINPGGTPGRVLQLAVSGAFRICVTREVFAEYEEVLRRPKFRIDSDVAQAALDAIASTARWIAEATPVRVCSDPDDDVFVSCALAAGALVIVTGNSSHFPGSHAGFQVLSPREFVGGFLSPA